MDRAGLCVSTKVKTRGTLIWHTGREFWRFFDGILGGIVIPFCFLFSSCFLASAFGIRIDVADRDVCGGLYISHVPTGVEHDLAVRWLRLLVFVFRYPQYKVVAQLLVYPFQCTIDRT